LGFYLRVFILSGGSYCDYRFTERNTSVSFMYFLFFVFHFLSHLLNRLGFRLVSLKDFLVDA